MSTSHLCISVTFLQPTCHARLGKEDAAPNEWPPSPLRLFQALVAAAAARWSGEADSTRAKLTATAPVAALRWLEGLTDSAPPTIYAPRATIGAAIPRYVPNNSADVVAARWARGDALATFEDRTRKVFRPTYMHGGMTVYYLWPLDVQAVRDARDHLPAVTAAARCIVALGWGIDVAIGDARLMDSGDMNSLDRETLERWCPSSGPNMNPVLRLPRPGTLDDLIQRHTAFLNRLGAGVFRPTPPVRTYRQLAYRRGVAIAPRPFAAFALRQTDNPDKLRAFRFENAAKVAAMLRHAACAKAKADMSHEFPGGSEQFVAGHGPRKSSGRYVDENWPRFSYLALPTVGSAHADGMIRRVIIAEPFGGDRSHAEWAACRLAGAPLIDEDTGREAARLERLDDGDKVLSHFTAVSKNWVSVSPVVLPGYDGLDMKKTAKLFSRACDHAGLPSGSVDSFKFTGPPRTAASGRPFVPNYLRGLPLRWAMIKFKSEVRGPIAIGAGRHGGLGVFMADES